VRKESRIAIGIVGFSALASSYLLGQGNATTSSFSANPVASSSAVAADPSATSDPSATAKMTSPSTTKTATPTPTKAGGNFNSGVVNYQYGTMELEAVVTSGKLTAINLLQATTHGRQYAPVPGLLVDAAIKAGGTNFGNLSGATFSTQAFKKALDSALAKAGL
jgi:uncharacterized protein with FMN-binding domain